MPSDAPSETPATDALGWRVLAIDDDPLFLEIVRVSLARSGCIVETSANPREGIARAIEGTFDLLLLDLMMPGLSGEEVLSLLKPLALQTPIVVVSASDEADAGARSRDLGAAGFLGKPVDPRTLATDLERIVVRCLSDDVAPAPAVVGLDRVVHWVLGEGPVTPVRRAIAFFILFGLLGVVVALLAT